MNFQDSALASLLSDDLGLGSAEEVLSLFGPLFPILNKAVVRQGSDRRDILIGRFGNDTLRGGGGNDLILGLSGNDSLFGEEDNDRIRGGRGNDLIDGGKGINTLWGGPGRDQFVLRSDGRKDTIKDYRDGVDRFRLQGGLTFSQLAIAQSGEDTQIRYLGSPDVAVVLEGVQASDLSGDDFVADDLTPTFNSLFVFGDSLSDPGNLFDLTGFFPPFPYSEGRFSNGDIWSNYFADSLDFESDRVFNFAVGGSTTGDVNALEPRIESITGTDLTLPGLSDQIDSYLTSLDGNPGNPDGLYVLWAGANDLFNVPDNPADVPGFLANSVSNIVDAVSRLAEKGADTFLVPNLPNLGLTPRILASGNSAQVENLAAIFNTGLSDALDDLELALDIDVVEFDTFSSTSDILTSPESFGFENVTDPLIQQLPPVSSDFFWWDDIHPTTAVHRVLSDAFQAELFDAGYLVNAEAASLLSTGMTSRSAMTMANRTGDSDLAASLVSAGGISEQSSWASSLV